MPKSKKKIALFAAVTAAALAAAMMLASCGSAPKSVWRMGSVTTPTQTVTLTYDETGRMTSQVAKTEDSTTVYTYSQFDEKGTGISRSTTVDGQPQNGTTWAYTYNGDKPERAMVTYSDGVTSDITYTYNGDKIASAVETQKQADATITITQTLDESGYLTETEIAIARNDGKNSLHTTTYGYGKDSKGNVTSVTITGTHKYTASNETTTDEPTTYTCICDGNGNVTEVRDADGKTCAQFTYVEIKNPCPAAQFGAQQKIFATYLQ